MKKLKNQQAIQEKNLEKSQSAHFKLKTRRNTTNQPSTSPSNLFSTSPSIFKRNTKLDLPRSNLKQELNSRIRNFMENTVKSKETIHLVRISSSMAIEKIGDMRNKVVERFQKISDREFLIENLILVKKISHEISKSPYCPSICFWNFSIKKLILEIELKIHDFIKTIKNRSKITASSSLSKEAIKLIFDFSDLLENYNFKGHKWLILQKKNKIRENSPLRRIKKSGSRLSDHENYTSLNSPAYNKKPKSRCSNISSGEIVLNSPDLIHTSSSKKGSWLKNPDPFQRSNSFSQKSNNELSNASSPSGSRDYGNKGKDYLESQIFQRSKHKKKSKYGSLKDHFENGENFSDDEKTNSVNLSLDINLDESYSDRMDEEKKFFSDSASNNRSCKDFLYEK